MQLLDMLQVLTRLVIQRTSGFRISLQITSRLGAERLSQCVLIIKILGHINNITSFRHCVSHRLSNGGRTEIPMRNTSNAMPGS